MDGVLVLLINIKCVISDLMVDVIEGQKHFFVKGLYSHASFLLVCRC